MTAAHKLLTTCFPDDEGGGPPGGGSWSDDVFSTYLYTGNGTTQTINNGIDLAGEGGLVWTKNRNNSFGNTGQETSTSNFLWDFTTGKYLNSDSTAPEYNISNLFQPLSNGFFINTNHPAWNASGGTQLQTSWTFRRAKRFFDIVTYTGDGTGGRLIGHSLGITPGMVVIKRTDNDQDWCVWHRGLPSENTLRLNTTSASINDNAIQGADAKVFILSPSNGTFLTNVLGRTYVAYIWAHDTDINGVVQCGSFTTDGSGNATVNLGWEPQYLLYKNVNYSNGDSHWRILDSIRGFTVTDDQSLVANTANVETASTFANPNATGFIYNSGTNPNQTYIYLAIRRPNKPPTTGTQVYTSKINATGPVTYDVGFPADLVISHPREGTTAYFGNRLTGNSKYLPSSSAAAEVTAVTVPLKFDKQNDFYVYTNTGLNLAHFFRRAPTFFDIVCYRGTGIPKTEKHNLAAIPEMLWVKRRDNTGDWRVYHKDIGNDRYLTLNSNGQKSPSITTWNTTSPTSTLFSLGTDAEVNALNGQYVSYLFSTCPGISKVGSYTGNGTSQLVYCGFSTGSRFVLIKRTDTAGDWFVWDSVRGIYPTADPHLSLNTTATEVSTDDSIDQNTNGFVVNQDAATNINVLGGQYIFYAIS